MVVEYVNKIFKYVKKVNLYNYNVHLREGRQHHFVLGSCWRFYSKGGECGTKAS
jgi:hypothetical protein